MTAAITDWARAEALLQWLTGPATRSDDGWTMSWSGSDHVPYPYPEASAYVLHLLALWPRPLSPAMQRRRDELQFCLERQLIECGALRRHDIAYVFDTAIALAALEAIARTGAPMAQEARRKGRAFVNDGIGLRHSCKKNGAWHEAERWSLSFQPHMLKCLRAEGVNFEPHLATLLGLQRADGAFALTRSDIVDTHVHAYALEGLLAVRQRADLSGPIARGVAWMASVQRDDGAMPRHSPGEAIGYCDTTAQAVRLFTLVDRDRFAANIERGFAYLEHLQKTSGGLGYHQDSDDCPTWGAVFACQAYLFRAGLHHCEDLI